MDTLNMDQLREVMKISYPTALQFARQHGIRDNSGYKRWLIPANVVANELNQEQADLNRRRDKLHQYTNGDT